MTLPQRLSYALLYAVVGYIGLALAIPPGYSSPVFPAAGVAIALTLRYGSTAASSVWLGSFLLNSFVAFQAGRLNGDAAVLAGLIGFGSALQSIFAALLVRRFLRADWQSLDNEGTTLRLLLLCGAVACVCSASFGAFSLYGFGVIPSSALFFTWWTWYLGDVIGVFLAMPLMYLLSAPKRESQRDRIKQLMVPLTIALGSSAVVFVAAAKWEAQNLQADVAAVGKKLQGQLEARVIAHKEMLAALARLIEINPNLTPAQFDRFTDLTLAEQADVFALSFNPLVEHPDRVVFENKMATLLQMPGFHIKQRVAGQLDAAAVGEKYVPVALISPLKGNEPAVGFDIFSEPTRRAAIERSLSIGQTSITAPIRLVQESKPRAGALLITPVSSEQPSRGQKGKFFGFAVAVIKVDQMIDIALADSFDDTLSVTVRDSDSQLSNATFYQSDSQTHSIRSTQFAWSGNISVADRQWVISVIPTDSYLDQARPLLAWAVGALGMFFAALLQVMLMASSGRAELVKRQVKEQTRYIEAQNLSLEAASQKAQSANEAKSRFLATMSHELRTPLNGILGLAKLIQLESEDEKQRDHAGIIMKSGESLLTVLNDVLDLAKVEAGKIELRDSAFDPCELLYETSSLFKGQFTHKGLGLKVECQPDGRLYFADAPRIRQMLSNLLSNAFKFTEQGQVSLDLTIKEGKAGQSILRFEVTDTGIGIPSEKVGTLFSPFTQLDDSYRRQHGGTGLGLSIVKSLSELMGGQAGVLANQPQGSVFWFEVKASHVDESSLHKPTGGMTEKAHRVADLPQFEGEVLVVEDDLVNQTVIKAFLNKLGIQPKIANNGQEAVTAYENGYRPQLVLMDLQMPVLDGYSATATLRAIEHDKAEEPMPIVALTAAAFQDERERCLAIGMNDMLPKPVLLETIIDTLSLYLLRKNNDGG